MLKIAVMPCLNEEAYVGHAIASLLGAPGTAGSDVHLVAVDNGSTDRTLDILADLGRAYAGRVHVVEEPRRGYVPPRNAGVMAAADISVRLGWPQDEVLILQTDADTIYQNGYIDFMEAAAVREGDSGILVGATKHPAEFAAAHGDYVRAERHVDNGLEVFEAADQDDVVVDDKVCAFRLSNYFAWGGLTEEFDEQGDQIHAETTRMFIRAKLSMGAVKHRINIAGAASSRRRVIEDPRYQFATHGFPREASWARAIRSGWEPIDVDAFGIAVQQGLEPEAAFLRRAHLIALFRFLPAYLGIAPALAAEGDVAEALAALPERGAGQLVAAPGLVITSVLRLIDTQPKFFRADRAG